MILAHGYNTVRSNSNSSSNSSSVVNIDVAGYTQNIKLLQRRCAAQGAVLCAVLKGDAYGHGIAALAQAAIAGGARYLGIVDNWEAELVRQAGVRCPLLRLRPALLSEVAAACAWQVEELVGCWDDATALAALGQKLGSPIAVHVAIDVGMGRMGFALSEAISVQQVCSLPGLRLRGIMTHFPCADSSDQSLTQGQLNRFNSFVVQQLAACNIARNSVLLHAANSAALLNIPGAGCDMVRVGIASYGIAPAANLPLPEGIAPVMRWRTFIASVRTLQAGATVGYGMSFRAPHDMRVATLPIGYADGWWRCLAEPQGRVKAKDSHGHSADHAEVIIHGRRCPVVGRASMNLLTIDVSAVPAAAPGDQVTLLGHQVGPHGDACIRAEEIAARAGTIGYEVCCAIGKMGKSLPSIALIHAPDLI